jgi:hypothetical protein
LFQCNLACAGCGKIDYPKEILQKRVSVEDALRAVDECGAPIVSIPGGEPLIHKEMPQIVAGIVARKKFVYLCTNAILLSKHIDEYKPSPYLTFSIHLDGNRQRHDESVCQEGVFDKAVAAIQLAREQGFSRHHQLHAVQRRESGRRGGVLRYGHGARHRRHHGLARLQLHHAPKQDVFLGRSASKQLFREIFSAPPPLRQVVVVQSFRSVPGLPRRQPDLPVHAVEQSDLQRVRLAAPLLSALRRGLCAELPLADRGHRVGASTAWASNPRCDNCMAHCGFEGTAVNDAFSHPFKALKAALRGPRVTGPMAPELPIEYAEGTPYATVAIPSPGKTRRAARSDAGRERAAQPR